MILCSSFLALGCTRTKTPLSDDKGTGAATPRAGAAQSSAADPSRCVQEYFVAADRICARLRDGSYRCRGNNEHKQSTHGNWPGLPPPTATLQAFPGPWQELVANARGTCGRRGGRLWCWGDNTQEWIQRFDVNAANLAIVAEPMLVEGVPPNVIDVDMQGIHLCALHDNRQATCKMGSPEVAVYSNLPEAAEQVVASVSSVCVRTRHDVWCHGNESWAVENADPSEASTSRSSGPPELFKIEGIPGPLRAMSQHCVLNEAGEVWCWGSNYGGLLGDGSAPRSCDGGCPGLKPRTGHRAKLPPARQLSSNGVQVCAVTDAGEVWCWGEPSGIELEKASTPHLLPVKLERLGNDNLRVHAARQLCVEKQDQRLLCWGNNDQLQISDQRCGGTGSLCPLTEVKFSCER